EGVAADCVLALAQWYWTPADDARTIATSAGPASERTGTRLDLRCGHHGQMGELSGNTTAPLATQAQRGSMDCDRARRLPTDERAGDGMQTEPVALRGATSAVAIGRADGPEEVIAASRISVRLWRLYAYFWLVCLVFPILALTQTPLAPVQLLIALAGL